MTRTAFDRMEEIAARPDVLAGTVSYVENCLKRFTRKQDRVLLCFPQEGPACLGTIMARALEKIGCAVTVWGPDYRWKTLLRLAFTGRISTIIAPPLVVLGLTKLAKVTHTPLYIRNAVLAGYPSLDWMTEGIRRGLDCQTWGFFGPGSGALVSGFSCGYGNGVHIRTEEYAVQVVDDSGNPVPDGTWGEVVLCSKREPDLACHTMEIAALDAGVCPCGGAAPRLLGFKPGKYVDPSLIGVGAGLQAWTSILDCRLNKGPQGLEMELVIFPGEKLPRLPSCAKLVLRSWDPETGIPFSPTEAWKNQGIYQDYY